MIPINNQNSFVKFFDPKILKKERELIDSWDYEICNQYGMDCLFVSQKAKFPKIKLNTITNDKAQTLFPLQHDLFFHAYGEISRPEYNEPFPTRVFVQFTEDLFAINGFGLNADLNTTLIFNKTSFALDGALAMADNQTINKHFNFKAEVDPNDKFASISYKSNGMKFKARFNWQNALKGLEKGELYEFDIDPGNLVKPDILNTFKRRYSAMSFVEKASLYFRCKNQRKNPVTGNRKLDCECIANFIVKNPWKPYADYLNRITPSVGDLVLIHGIDDNIIKLEIMEVEAENKTQQGISPLLGSYSFKCTAKPYIADNNASATHDPITAPTDINAKKLIIQTVLNHDASKIADSVSVYEKLYTDEMGFDFTEDDVYGGYDLEPPNGISNSPNVPVHNIQTTITSNARTSYAWNEYANQSVEIKDPETKKVIATYSADNIYTYLKNLFDSNYTDYINQKWHPDISVSYSMFDREISTYNWQERLALNIPLWYSSDLDEISTRLKKINGKVVEPMEEISVITAYTEADRRLRQIRNNNDLFNEFIDKNGAFLKYTNEAAYDGNLARYQIPIMEHELSSTYISVLNDKRDKVTIEIPKEDVYELSSFVRKAVDTYGKIVDISVQRYVNDPNKLNLRTDLYDIEQYNLGSSEFIEKVKDYLPDFKKWKELPIEKMKGPLITIYQFESDYCTRLATNGESLFFESKDGEDNLYRAEITSFELNKEISGVSSEPYNGISVPLRRNLNWLEATQHGVYFNTAYGKRIKLFGDKENVVETNLSHLNYENDFSSPPNSFILTFKNSKFYLTVQPTDKAFTLKFCQ